MFLEYKIILEDIIDKYDNKYPILVDGKEDGPVEFIDLEAKEYVTERKV